MLRRIERSQLQGLAAQSLFALPEADLDEYLKVAEVFFHHLDELWEKVDGEPTDLVSERPAGRRRRGRIPTTRSSAGAE
jgi:hypothetical protein